MHVNYEEKEEERDDELWRKMKKGKENKEWGVKCKRLALLTNTGKRVLVLLLLPLLSLYIVTSLIHISLFSVLYFHCYI